MAQALFYEPIFQAVRMEEKDTELIALLGRRDEIAFEQVFKAHFKALHAYACTILKDEDLAEEMVQNVFVKLWERSEKLTISGSITAYLYRAVYNESLNNLKHQKVKSAYQLHVSYRMKNETDTAAKRISLQELEGRLQKAMDELPEQCRTIFQMSRFEELRYQDIAHRLGISIKTVENQMGKALKLLRLKLIDFLPLTILLFLNL